ncbi:Os03g0141300 [Oryza sativa Japonica Group]|uniref:Os03g0141300 protein n=3 Tax=Oryza TaxID=4527 RepID=Q10RZ0_ORYSJ|nr:RNA recognition motif family protein, expressed [Oryza sativa Japonica Group]BAS82228.1 Os03g0141300 [Oryza sativa Japonica Group]
MALPTLCKMFVGGIGPYTGDEDLRRHFQLFGYVASVHMPIDRHTGRHHGFAFIQFTCLEHLINALAYRHTIHGHTLGTRLIEPRLSRGVTRYTTVFGNHIYRIGHNCTFC